MGRGRRQRTARVEARPASGLPRYRARRGEKPSWGDYAVARYGDVHSDKLISTEIAERFAVNVSPRQVGNYLASRKEVLRRREPEIIPFSHDGVSDEMTPARQQRLDEEIERRRADGEPPAAIDDWVGDEVARYTPVAHLCYSEEELFNSRRAVAAIIRRLKKWHRTVGRPVAGEGFEDLLAGAWTDLGYNVLLAPRGYDGADAHVELQNQWVAMSMKSEARAKPSSRTIRLTSIAPHDLDDIRDEIDCCDAVTQAWAHVSRYERLIYLLSEESHFPGETNRRARRYTLFELPQHEIAQALAHLPHQEFAHYFSDPNGGSRNTFSAKAHTELGRYVCNVTVSKRPPRVTLSGIDLGRCTLIASYWTQAVEGQRRLDRDQAMSGRFSARKEPRWDFRSGRIQRYRSDDS
jgi:hypothetical protein